MKMKISFRHSLNSCVNIYKKKIIKWEKFSVKNFIIKAWKLLKLIKKWHFWTNHWKLFSLLFTSSLIVNFPLQALFITKLIAVWWISKILLNTSGEITEGKISHSNFYEQFWQKILLMLIKRFHISWPLCF